MAPARVRPSSVRRAAAAAPSRPVRRQGRSRGDAERVPGTALTAKAIMLPPTTLSIRATTLASMNSSYRPSTGTAALPEGIDHRRDPKNKTARPDCRRSPCGSDDCVDGRPVQIILGAALDHPDVHEDPRTYTVGGTIRANTSARYSSGRVYVPMDSRRHAACSRRRGYRGMRERALAFAACARAICQM